MPLSGKTPMVKINYLYEGQKQHLYAKLEAYNPSGSIKDRIAEYIVYTAEKNGRLRRGDAIIEVTSGNTGIALASIGARKGYDVHIFMPSWVSEERKKIIRMYGATVHEVTREEGGFAAAFDRADDLAGSINSYMPLQFENPENVNAHRLFTGREILQQLPKVTDFVSGIGTGGTLMGVGQALKQAGDARVIAIEPDTLPLLTNPDIRGTHRIEGIGDDFIPKIVDTSLIDEVFDINDADAIEMSKKLSLQLGLGVGISSGANFLGCVMANRTPGREVATVFADDNKKYLSTDLSAPQIKDDRMLSFKIELLNVEKLPDCAYLQACMERLEKH